MLSVEETLALANMNPEFEMKSSQINIGGWNKDTDINQMRVMMAKFRETELAAQPDSSTLPFVEQDIRITTRDAATITIRIHKPRDVPDDGCPAMIVFHGGGFVIGGLGDEAPLCQLFTTLGGIAVNVDYRLAPEHPFPTPVNDCFDAVKWTIENAKSLGINLQKGFLLGGVSAGADLALGVAYLCGKEKLAPPVTGVYTAVSGAATLETIPEKYRDLFLSPKQNAFAPILDAETIKFISDKYKPDPKSPVAYPIASPDLRDIPKTYFQACGLDPLRDCTLIMEQVWRDAGIQTKLDIYPGLPHGFWDVFPQADFSKKHKRDCRAGLEWLLSRE
ncbi:AB hydrolase superfamily protein 3 [Colletotrichum chlorophyti]|uniref:AB hydrolase superfamily protein 3 n=1 Tax=Colletotrichum chlorophyti TaxID=708187 RepID=A0A1Q8RUY7_9PEZI|nr:AB hydrolase superfamily protein 3 [Colletotrichum chlorophyti]